MAPALFTEQDGPKHPETILIHALVELVVRELNRTVIPDETLSDADREWLAAQCRGPAASAVAWAVQKLARAGWFLKGTDRIARLKKIAAGPDGAALAQAAIWTLAAPLVPHTAGNSNGDYSVRGISLLAQRDPERLLALIEQVQVQGYIILDLGDFTFSTQGETLPDSMTGPDANLLVRRLALHWEVLRRKLTEHVEEHMPDVQRMRVHAWWLVDRYLHGQWYPTADAYPRTTTDLPERLRRPLMEQFRDARENYRTHVRENVRRFYGAYHPAIHPLPGEKFPIPVAVLPNERHGFPAPSRKTVSIQRIAIAPVQGDLRVFFYDPSLSLTQRQWGKATTVSTWGHGEFPGEASLGFAEFALVINAYPFDKDVQPMDPPPADQAIIDKNTRWPVFKVDR